MYGFYLLLLGLMIVALAVMLAAALVHGYFMLHNSVPYVVLPDGAMNEVTRVFEVGAHDLVVDLGCGDGRVILALRETSPEASYVGIENDWVVWLRAWVRLRGKARLVRGEIAVAELGSATRVFVYLGPELMAQLEPRFERELPNGARVVSVQFPLPYRPPDEIVELSKSAAHANRLYVYNY